MADSDDDDDMPKRKCSEEDCATMMSEQQRMEEHTPVRGKRLRRISDVIDSMGEFNSPSSSSRGSPFTSASTPSSSSSAGSGFVTPRRTRDYFSATSPDQGYLTPECVRTTTTDWLGGRYESPDAIATAGESANNYSFLPEEKLATMPVHKDSDRYNMEHRNRGKCVIFNHESFDTGFAPRHGSSADARRIEITFQRLGFTVEICDDYEHTNIMNKITELTQEDHTDDDCICIFVLTHGLTDDMIFAKDVAYKQENLWKPFTMCTTLAGKPKLFFFQACRGDHLDAGVRLHRFETYNRTVTDSAHSSYKIPKHADFLLAYSTVQGFYSWRHPEEGTWYVQTLCDVIDEYHTSTDLVKMLTIMKRKVATDFSSYNNIDPTMHEQKQMPSTTTMLIRDLYFTPKNV